jgi:KDO2-lipid IV(A) lauroyltransferase
MDDRGTFHLDFRDPLLVPPDARRPGRAVEWVRRALADLEEQVRLHPEQSNDYFFWESAEEEPSHADDQDATRRDRVAALRS